MNAIAYYRFSSSNQHEESIEEQQEVVRQYADKNNITIIKEYVDRAESATTDDRPNFKLMTSEITSGAFAPDFLLVHKTNRFARNSYDAVVYKHELGKRNVKVIAVTQPIGDGPEGIILERLYEALDEYYSANLSIEVKTKMKQHAKKAKHLGGTPPLGYDVFFDGESRKYKINESEAHIVKTIFSMYTAGKSYGAIIKHLNENNYKTKKERPFQQTSIYEILRNEKYTGTYVYNKTVSKTNGKRNNHALKDDDQIVKIPDAIPVIIPKEQFEQAKQIMDKRKLAPAASKAKEVYLLTGLVTCGKCGGTMVGNRARWGRNQEVYAFYECNTRKRLKTCDMKAINKDFLETKVLDYLDDNLFNEENIPKLVTILNLAHKEKNKNNILELEHAKSELKKIEEKIGNMIKAISDGLYNPSMKNALSELEEAKSNTLKIISINSNKSEFELTEKMIWNYVKKDKEGLRSGDPLVKKSIISSYVRSITIFDNYIAIECSLDLTGGGGAHTFKSKLDYRILRNQSRPSEYKKTLVI